MRILLVRAGALGDLLLLRPVVASFRSVGAHVTVMAPRRPGSALIAPGEADALLAWDGPDAARLLSADPTAEASSLRAALGTYDVALCYSRNPDLAAALAALAPRVIVQDPEPGGEHAADWMARPLAELGVPVVVAPPCVPRDEEASKVRVWCDRLPSAFLAVHPGSGAARKNWPLARFLALAAELAEGRPWLLSLGPAEEDVAAPDAVVTRDLPPRLLGALLAHAGLYVGNDSGVSHLAAAWGVPTVALFGPTDPAVWAPRGPHVRIVRAPSGGMDSLTLDDVRAACRAPGFKSADRR